MQRLYSPGHVDDQRPSSVLVERAQHGDVDAFGVLYRRFQPGIHRYLSRRTGDREVALDLTQQVFLHAWQSIPRYEQRGTPFAAWLYRIAHNLMVDYFRHRTSIMDLEGVELSGPDDGEVYVFAQETTDALLRAIGRLREDYRQVLVLRFLMEKPAAEVGEVMGRSAGAVRVLQFRALDALRRSLAASEDACSTPARCRLPDRG